MIARALKTSNASLLVTRDPAAHATDIALNTGIVVVRNDANAALVLEELWGRASAAASSIQAVGCIQGIYRLVKPLPKLGTAADPFQFMDAHC